MISDIQVYNQQLESQRTIDRCLGLMCVYNEEDILEQTLKYHIEEGIEFIVLDNGSSDRSLQIAQSFLNKGVLSVRSKSTETYKWAQLLNTLLSWAKEFQPDWCMLVDADTFFESPWPGVGLLDGIRHVASQGFNVINFDNFEFWPVLGDDSSENDIRRRLRYYTWADDRQEKCWKAFFGANNSRTGGHVIDFPSDIIKKRASMNFVIRHYRIRSIEHGKRKVFSERIPRFRDEPEDWHVHYNGFGRDDWYFELPAEWLNEYREGQPWNCERKFHGWDPRVLPHFLLPAKQPAQNRNSKITSYDWDHKPLSLNNLEDNVHLCNSRENRFDVPPLVSPTGEKKVSHKKSGEELSLRDQVHVLIGENLAVVIDSVTFDIAYLSAEIGRKIQRNSKYASFDSCTNIHEIPVTILTEFERSGFLEKKGELDRLAPYRRLLEPQPFRVLDIIPSFACNLACKYCYLLDSNKQGSKWHQCQLSTDDGKSLVESFLNTQPTLSTKGRIPAEICFIGGEPLLHPQLLGTLIRRSREHEKGGREALSLTIVTNGTLITSSIAALLAEYDVFVIVSLDGKRDTHDKMRITRAKNGSFDQAIRGYNQLKDAGCRVGISQIIGKHNLDTFQDETLYLLNELKPDDLCVNSCLHSHPGQKNYHMVKPLDFSKSFAALFDGLASLSKDKNCIANWQHSAHLNCGDREIGSYGIRGNISNSLTNEFDEESQIPEQMVRRFINLISRKAKLHFCPAQTHKLVVGPSGVGWCCEGFAYLGEGGRPWKEWFVESKDITEMRSLWAATSPVNNTACHECPLVLLCGLGCRYDAATQSGSFFAPDAYRCQQDRWLFNWFLLEFIPRLCKIRSLKDAEIRHLKDSDRDIVLKRLMHSNSKVAWR